ncbi:MAG: flagellin [bacterium]
MSRINQNVPSMIAQRVNTQNNLMLSGALEKLSTGYRINRGSDGPAGLIISENLRGELRGIDAAIGNAQRAEQVVNIAEGGLQEISNMLIEVQSLVGQTANEAGLSSEEREANQLQIDNILSTIDRIANSVSFQGTKLLNGNFDYTLSGQYTAASGFGDIAINSVKISDNPGAFRQVTVTVTQSAQTARQFLRLSAGGIANGGSGAVTFEIAGTRGAQQFSFASGTSQTDIRNAINAFTEALGVSATVCGQNIRVDSTGFGTESFVRMREIANANAATNFIAPTAAGAAVGDLRSAGRDATVNINGVVAVARGLSARVALDGFDVSVSLIGAGGSSFNTANGTRSFYVTGGGADFNLAPDVSLASKVSLGIETVTSTNLGTSGSGFLSELKSGGSANVQNGNLTKAQEILDLATKQVSSLRGRLGAFTKNVVGSTITSLGVTLENTTAAESAIRDTDFAAETAAMTRAQILIQASTQALALSNQAPQAVLQLMRG